METMIITCPKCKQTMHIEHRNGQDVAICPTCGMTFIIQNNSNQDREKERLYVLKKVYEKGSRNLIIMKIVLLAGFLLLVYRGYNSMQLNEDIDTFFVRNIGLFIYLMVVLMKYLQVLVRFKSVKEQFEEEKKNNSSF